MPILSLVSPTTADTLNISNVGILSIAGAALVFLIKYLISTKDKNTEVIMKDIKEMKDLFYTISNETSLLNNNLHYSKIHLESLTVQVKQLIDRQFEQARKIEQLVAFKSQSEKHFSELEKKYNELKKRQ